MGGHRSQPLQRDPFRACQRPPLLPLPRAGGTLQKDTVSRDGVTGWPGIELRAWEHLIRAPLEAVPPPLIGLRMGPVIKQLLGS